MMACELHTRRLRLLPLSRTDFDAMHAMTSSPEVMRFTSFPPLSRKASDEAMESMLGEARRATWVVRTLEGTTVGYASAFDMHARGPRGEIAYMFLPAVWGRGFATELVSALVRFCHIQGLVRIDAKVDARNTASCRVLEKCGFTREGLSRAWGYKAGEFYDVVFYGLVNERLLKRHTASALS